MLGMTEVVVQNVGKEMATIVRDTEMHRAQQEDLKREQEVAKCEREEFKHKQEIS